MTDQSLSRERMGNSQSEIPVQANEKAEEERPQSQPQATRPTAEVLPSRAKQIIIQHEVEANPPKADDMPDDGLHAGVFSNDMKEYSWVQKSSGKKCFMLFARGLSITWADTPAYWQWNRVRGGPGNEMIEEAELLNVCWLEVNGGFEISRLSPGTTYEVLFMIMLKDPAYGWGIPVNCRLALPDGTKQERRENLVEKPRWRWIEIPAGKVRRSMTGGTGKMEFSMIEYGGGQWKRGLVIKGVQIRPKK